MLIRAPRLPRKNKSTLSQVYAANSSSNFFASFRSSVSKPSVNRSEQFARLLRLPLVAPEPRHAHCCAELPGLCLLLAGYCEGALEIRFAFLAWSPFAPALVGAYATPPRPPAVSGEPHALRGDPL